MCSLDTPENTCPFSKIPLNGLFQDPGSNLVMQKTSDSTAVVYNDPVAPVYTYGPRKPVTDLRQTSDVQVKLLMSEGVIDPEEETLAALLGPPQE